MQGGWSVRFYRDPKGTEPVRDWLSDVRKSAGPKAAAKVERAIDLLSDQGLALGGGMVERLRSTGEAMWELRATYQRNPYRVLFYNREGRTLVLLHGFHKKVPAIPRRDIALAEQRAAEDRRRRR